MEAAIPDREAIRRYWETKVVGAQANITCRLLNLYLDGDTAVAEWLAEFDDVAQGVRKRMQEIAVLEFDGHLISSLREYWASESVTYICPCCGRVSHNPNDVRERYCGACHWWTGAPALGPAHLEEPCAARDERETRQARE